MTQARSRQKEINMKTPAHVSLARHWFATDMIEAGQLDHAASKAMKARAKSGEFDDMPEMDALLGDAVKYMGRKSGGHHGQRTSVTEVRYG